MSAGPKITVKPKTALRPVRQRAAKVDIDTAHDAIATRFPNVLAKLAK